MANKTTTKAEKLQEVIMAKTMNSIAGVPETKKETKAKKTKATETKEVKETKAKKETKTKAKTEKTGREAKYLYPEGCTSSLERKKFRAEFRATVRRFENNLSKAKEGSKEFKAITKEYKEYKAKYLR